MKALLEKIMAGYGSQVILIGADETRTTVRAFVQPVTEKNWESLRAVQPLGEFPLGTYIYIGPAEAVLREGDSVCAGDQSFVVMSAESLVLADEALYVWGCLRKKGGPELWTS